MEQKQQRELGRFTELPPASSNLDSLTEGLAKMAPENRPPCLWRAQRRNESRAAVLQRAPEDGGGRCRVGFLASCCHEDKEKLAVTLEAKNLEMEIPADSHCMCRAVQDQLSFSVTLESLRGRTANYMGKHVHEFLPFYSDPETREVYTREGFFNYCDNIVYNAWWAGQLELRAVVAHPAGPHRGDPDGVPRPPHRGGGHQEAAHPRLQALHLQLWRGAL